ncbi:hypothetical protein DERP_007396 [Dermatophagoides pteronyssinus]|uniref:Epidermal retinol dehydrogenase 2-like n=1 Tax=Dermatophagoides pteronyssinus TaxID=6956 RepID=A0ABQ8J481_DERPT|nr:hypothetical protein DERP_007396 [Dermatophagoides pteronyssinus]
MEQQKNSSSKMKMTRTTSNRFISVLLIFYYLIKNFLLLFIPIRLLKQPKNIHDKLILITGGGNGIGQLMTLKFLKLGAKVIVWDIDPLALDRTRKLAKDMIKKMAKQIENDLGNGTRVDILINNAGIVVGKNILDLSDDEIQRTMMVNTISHFFTIRTFLPGMIEQKSGHIVTISSVAGDIGAGSLTDYCTSKFAATGLTESLEFELAKANLDKQIKISVVKPWVITTGMFDGLDSGIFPPLKPETVAEKIVEGILFEQSVIVIPWYFKFIIILWKILPHDCLVHVYNLVGAFESMDHFVGRK